MRLGALIAAALYSIGLLVVQAQQPVTTVPLTPPAPPVIVDGLEILPVQGNVHLVVGAGSNVAVQIGDEGAFVVDSGGSGHS